MSRYGTPIAHGDEPINDDAPFYKAYWLTEYMEGPSIMDDELQLAYNAFLQNEGVKVPTRD